MYSFANLWRQYRACRRNKRSTINQLRFEIDAEAKLLELQQELRQHTYRPGRSICFVTDGPKPREAFAADFRDRIVHHLLVHHLERVFEPCFIHDSYACRRGKGTLAASDRLMEFLRRAPGSGSAWASRYIWAQRMFPARCEPDTPSSSCARSGGSVVRGAPSAAWYRCGFRRPACGKLRASCHRLHPPAGSPRRRVGSRSPALPRRRLRLRADRAPVPFLASALEK
jgi:hypothetical protein